MKGDLTSPASEGPAAYVATPRLAPFNEGAVREGESRTSTTEKRAAIGTAVGAVIGAIAGGGKGAAIGAIVGAGAEAGSVYTQGADDMELKRSTEVRVRSGAPRSGSGSPVTQS